MEKNVKLDFPEIKELNLDEDTTAKVTEILQKNVKAFHGDGVKRAYRNVETALAELGFEKPSGLKTSDFVKTVLSELQTKKAEPKTETKTETPPPADNNSKIIEKLQSVLESKENEIKNFQTQLNKEKIKSKLYVHKNKLGLDDELNELIIENAINQILPSAELNNNKLFFKDAEGEILTNDKGEPLSAVDVLMGVPAFAKAVKKDPEKNTADVFKKTNNSKKIPNFNSYTEAVNYFVSQGYTQDEAYGIANKNFKD